MVEEYLELEKNIDYENKKIEVFERIAGTDDGSSELEEQREILADLSGKQRMHRYELSVGIICLAEKILKEMAPTMNDNMMKYLQKLMIHLSTIILSSLVTRASEYVNAENK